jgi:hypothetical protein
VEAATARRRHNARDALFNGFMCRDLTWSSRRVACGVRQLLFGGLQDEHRSFGQVRRGIGLPAHYEVHVAKGSVGHVLNRRATGRAPSAPPE